MIITSLSCPVTTEHCYIIKAACFGAQQVLLYLQMPYIPRHHHQFFLFPKCVSVCTRLCDSMWRNPIPLHSDICVCSVWSKLPILWVITDALGTRHSGKPLLCVIGYSLCTLEILHSILGVGLEECVLLLSAEIILSNTARTDWGSECLWGFSKLMWIETEGEISCHFMSACVCVCLRRTWPSSTVCSVFIIRTWKCPYEFSILSFSLFLQNWSGMKCQFKLFRMAMALVCSKSEYRCHIPQFNHYFSTEELYF